MVCWSGVCCMNGIINAFLVLYCVFECCSFKSITISYANEYLTTAGEIERERERTEKKMYAFRGIWFAIRSPFAQCTVIPTANPVIYNRLVVIELGITWFDLICLHAMCLCVQCAFLSKEAYAFCVWSRSLSPISLQR